MKEILTGEKFGGFSNFDKNLQIKFPSNSIYFRFFLWLNNFMTTMNLIEGTRRSNSQKRLWFLIVKLLMSLYCVLLCKITFCSLKNVYFLCIHYIKFSQIYRITAYA